MGTKNLMKPFTFPRCTVTPESNHQAVFRIDGQEKTRWHFGPEYSRPFFDPFMGPSGVPLTRMGHPGAPDHDHHRSIWFAHMKVLGIDFWADNATRIRQKRWLVYHDSNEEAIMAVELDWFDGHDPKPLVEQQLVAAVRLGPNQGTLLELQSTFRPVSATLEFGQTNFGFLAVRVSKNISARFGGGRLTGADGATGEKNLFGKPNAWMDYSGPVAEGIEEGITYFDHPTNPGQPMKWHVRDDGWMGASICRDSAVVTTKDKPLTIRHLLFAHSGPSDKQVFQAIHAEFTRLKPYVVAQSRGPFQYMVERVK
jgi:hypothetical protein